MARADPRGEREVRRGRLAWKTATGPREFAQPEPARPPTTTVICTRCKAHYVDDEPGRGAHRIVFGHTPTLVPIEDEPEDEQEPEDGD